MQKLQDIKGVGRAAEVKLARLGILSIRDLLMHLPRRYNDYSQIESIGSLKAGSRSIKAKVESINGRYVRRGLHITEAVLTDDTSSVKAVWFNQPYLKKSLKTDKDYFFSGEYQFERGRYQFLNPAHEVATKARVNAARVLPVYPETKGLSSKQLRRYIHEAMPLVEKVEVDIPDDLANKYTDFTFAEAIRLVHMPDDIETAEVALKRLAFGELVTLALSGINAQTQRLQLKSVPLKFFELNTKKFVDELPFKLTDDQRKSAWEIIGDIQKDQPMNRLLDGDVGSGKTVVAAMSVFNALLSKKQVAILAPTTILAEQHLKSFTELLPKKTKIRMLTSAATTKEKQTIKRDLADGKIDVLIGTHAVLQPDVIYKNLALIVIDEQHRFGVEQRRQIQAQLGLMPHVLTMSATPIPRTLALTLYGELDISIIKQLPPGRKPITTSLHSSGARRTIDEAIEKHLNNNQQVYVVTPLIEDSDLLPATSVEAAFERYSKAFSKHNVVMMHGKLKEAEKTAIMHRFSAGKIDILVSTTVIEVGVDVPNASLMVIESAERFGLAQLHQLRGRVGRGSAASHCYLVTTTAQRPPKRLEAVVSSTNGFELAELDLELRGAGAIYGTRQSGALDLKIAKLSDVTMVKEAKKAALEFHESGQDLLQYPQMAAQVARFKAITHLN